MQCLWQKYLFRRWKWESKISGWCMSPYVSTKSSNLQRYHEELFKLKCRLKGFDIKGQILFLIIKKCHFTIDPSPSSKMPCDDKLFLSCTDPLLFDFHLEPLHPGLHLFIHHHRVDPSVQGDFFGLERPICTQDSCSGWWLALHLGFVSSNHSKPLLPPFDRLAHLCLFQCSWGRLFQELNSFRKRVYKYKFEASYRSKSVCPLLQQIHIQLSASTGYLSSPLLFIHSIHIEQCNMD